MVIWLRGYQVYTGNGKEHGSYQLGFRGTCRLLAANDGEPNGTAKGT